MTFAPPKNDVKELVGLAMHYSELRRYVDAIDTRVGIPEIKQLEKEIAIKNLESVEQNMAELMESIQPINQTFASLSLDVEKMNADIPYENSVFLMTKFPDKPGESLKDKQLDLLTESIDEALRPYGLVIRRADKRNYASSKQLWDNVRIHMLGCKYGVAVLESKYKDEFNPNVALEYGFMNALGREVILLIEQEFEHRRADIVGTLGKHFRWSSDEEAFKQSVIDAVESWMIDIGMRKIQ